MVTWLVDGHVHIHPVFDRRRFFDAAFANFAAAARTLGLPAGTPGVLMLTESSGTDAFGELLSAVGGEIAPGWRVSATAEPVSVQLTPDGIGWVYVVAGRQIVTADRLEVLALATVETVPDGLPLAETVARVREVGGLPVVPWGFGKWTGSRGRLLADFLHHPSGWGVLLGDNGGRLDIGPVPPLLRAAQSRGIPVVPGSDPLPFTSHTERAGGYGFVLTAEADSHRPADTVVQYLLSRKDQPCRFGRLTRLPAFLLSQLRMQLRGRSPARP